MYLYIVVSYIPFTGISAKVLVDGIYDTLEKAQYRQHHICNGVIPSQLNNNSMYGMNGKVSWIKKVALGDMNRVDIYSPDPL